MIQSLYELGLITAKLGLWSLEHGKTHPKSQSIADEMGLICMWMKELHKHNIPAMIEEMYIKLDKVVPKEKIIEMIKNTPDGKWWDWEHGMMVCSEDIEVLKRIELSLEYIEALKKES